MSEVIHIEGARQHNLQNLAVDIPKNKLVVITGVSGSGKSSLAFDTVFAEGQRRYVESLSSYARQFLGRMQKPDVDVIEGLSPAIAIEQKTASHNPRSTVGTVTEIYDFLRLLYGRAGDIHCPSCGDLVSHQSIDQMLDQIFTYPESSRIIMEAPVVMQKKGRLKATFQEIAREGYVRVDVDGITYEIEEILEKDLDKNKKHDISIVVDRVILRPESRGRIQDSLETTLRAGNGYANLLLQVPEEDDQGERTYRSETLPLSQKFACPRCHISMPEIAPRLFSFNSPTGACPKCAGLGFLPFQKNKDVSFMDYLPMNWEDKVRQEEFQVCPLCHGTRLKEEALAVTVGSLNISELTQLTIGDALAFMQAVPIARGKEQIMEPLIKEIVKRLQFIVDVGLDYLTLSRSATTLSGGESQRIRLATQIGSFLSGVLYVLDEPSIGLHQRDNAKLLRILKNLRDLGNTVLVVEHDEETMREADCIVDIGPGAGHFGGKLVGMGTADELSRQPQSLTGAFLSGKETIDLPTWREVDSSTPHLHLHHCHKNNLQNVSVDIPLGVFVAVTGVSGSGKSSLVNGCVVPLVKSQFSKFKASVLDTSWVEDAQGLDQIQDIVVIDQSPIGRTPRSNPATYTGLFTHIRQLFADTPKAKMWGYTMRHFSFNVSGGRCELCRGAGFNKVEMNFLPDIFVPCENCNGTRYNAKTLEIDYKNKNIAEVLDMTVADALEFFANIPPLKRILQTLSDVGLDYITLGQPSTELSGGEAQRVKLATELARRNTGGWLYVLDEPTTGLHRSDVRRLIHILQALVDKGNTVLVIEHNLDVIKNADFIIDMGPEGGDRGGFVIGTGSPADLAANPKSYTGAYLKEILEKERPAISHVPGPGSGCKN